MFINIQLNRENALDMKPMRDRVNSIDNSTNWFRKPNQESNSLSTKRQTLIVKLMSNMYFDCGPSTQSYASLVYLGMHASRKLQSWQKVSYLLEQEYRVVTHTFG